MVSSAIGLFTLAVAVRLASDQTVVLGQTTDRMDMFQSARTAVDLLSEDLRHAGVGIGYRPDGQFGGLIRGGFTVAGGAQFFADGLVQRLSTGEIPTDDLGLRVATGDLRTVASFLGTQGQICAGSDIAVDDTVVLLSREALHVQTVRVLSLANAACARGACRDGCATFTYGQDLSYASDPLAAGANYVGGTMIGDYGEIVWFVVPGTDGNGELRRARVTQQEQCANRDDSCGGLVAEDIETLQVAVWQWDDNLNQWVNQTPTASIGDRRRLRVDVEVVVRGGEDRDDGARQPVELALHAGRCAGGTCGTKPDKFRRFVIRTSVELRNGGRMLIR